MSQTIVSPVVLIDNQDGVATLTLNRPEARNALNNTMCEELLAAVTARVRRDRINQTLLDELDAAVDAVLPLPAKVAGR